MSILQNIIDSQQNPIIQTHNSIEGLLNSIIPIPLSKPVNENIVQKEKDSPELILERERASVLLSDADKLEIESINEEIDHDLKAAFLNVPTIVEAPLNEAVTIQEAAEAQHYYKLYRDKDETFECKISVEGTSLVNSSVRLVLETETWNILFFGKIYKDGRCVVPLKKVTIFDDGLIGKARLEVIIDDTIFAPWEETFIVEGSKKVTVEIKPQGKISVNLNDN